MNLLLPVVGLPRVEATSPADPKQTHSSSLVLPFVLTLGKQETCWLSQRSS